MTCRRKTKNFFSVFLFGLPEEAVWIDEHL
jgi:hypothetical protein